MQNAAFYWDAAHLQQCLPHPTVSFWGCWLSRSTPLLPPCWTGTQPCLSAHQTRGTVAKGLEPTAGQAMGRTGGWRRAARLIQGWRRAGCSPRQPGCGIFASWPGPPSKRAAGEHPLIQHFFFFFLFYYYYYFYSFPGWVSPCLEKRGQSCLIQLPSQGLLLARLYVLLFARFCMLLQGR